MDKVKESYTQELRQLLNAWHALETNPNATIRDYNRLSARIQEICNALDAIDRGEVLR